jgi:spore coat protein U-like protein
VKAHWKVWAVIACASVSAGASAADTNTLSGTINSKLVLTTGCAIDTGGGSAGVTNFGTLDFGTQPSTFNGSLKAAVSGSANATQVTCSTDVTAVKVTVDAGKNGTKGKDIGAGTRALSNGTSYVPYEVYVDTAGSKSYVAGTAQSVAIATPGSAFALPVYGIANKTSSAALAAGTYTDVLNVTLGW